MQKQSIKQEVEAINEEAKRIEAIRIELEEELRIEEAYYKKEEEVLIAKAKKNRKLLEAKAREAINKQEAKRKFEEGIVDRDTLFWEEAKNNNI